SQAPSHLFRHSSPAWGMKGYRDRRRETATDHARVRSLPRARQPWGGEDLRQSAAGMNAVCAFGDAFIASAPLPAGKWRGKLQPGSMAFAGGRPLQARIRVRLVVR